MAYPQPTPIIRAKDAHEFFERLEAFTLTSEQRKLYEDALKRSR
jgi:hypothetical protein